MPFNTFTVASAVTPSVIETYFSHFLNRAPLRQKPTAHVSYHEGLALIRNFLDYASKHSVDDLQAFTQQWVPVPSWVRVDNVEIARDFLDRSARLITEQLGPDGIEKVGGENWWQWRGPGTGRALKAEWIEMKKDYQSRKRTGSKCERVVLYVHGGAYYFGSVDEHRYQMQRHARKLQARLLAPRYRLAPQFPFPCGLQDNIAAYLYCLEMFDPGQILFAGDSAGGGMVLAMLVTLRDQGIPLPAGAILLSPWSDLTHSFPSVAGDGEGDYIPSNGLGLYKPSMSWPPQPAEPEAKNTGRQHLKVSKTPSAEAESRQPSSTSTKQSSSKAKPNGTRNGREDNITALPPSPGIASSATREPKDTALRPGYGPNLSVELDGKIIEILDQIQLYTTNQLLSHPLVSPVLQPSLGGLPPLLIQVGGSELLRDEQLYLAHKAANPQGYIPSQVILDEYDPRREAVDKWPPTDVQLQLWDDLCHVPHTLSFTRPAKYMYRGVAQFGAWALARKKGSNTDDIVDVDETSIISSGDEDGKEDDHHSWPSRGRSDVPSPSRNGAGDTAGQATDGAKAKAPAQEGECVGKAGDPIPQFRNHMVRQRVSRHGIITPLEPAHEIPALKLDASEIGVLKPVPVRKYLNAKKLLDAKFAKDMRKVQKLREKEAAKGYEGFPGEQPPPTALASRRRKGMDDERKKAGKSWGLAMWTGWGSKHDEETMERHEGGKKGNAQGASRQGETPNPSQAGPDRNGSPVTSSGQTRKQPTTSAERAAVASNRGREETTRPSSSRSPFRKPSALLEGSSRPHTSRERLVSPSLTALHSPPAADGLGSTFINGRPASYAGTHSEPPRPPTAEAQPASQRLEGTDTMYLSPSSNRSQTGTVAYPFKLRNAVWNPSTATLDSQAPDGTLSMDAVSGSTEHPTSVKYEKSNRSTPMSLTPRSSMAPVGGGVKDEEDVAGRNIVGKRIPSPPASREPPNIVQDEVSTQASGGGDGGSGGPVSQVPHPPRKSSKEPSGKARQQHLPQRPRQLQQLDRKPLSNNGAAPSSTTQTDAGDEPPAPPPKDKAAPKITMTPPSSRFNNAQTAGAISGDGQMAESRMEVSRDMKQQQQQRPALDTFVTASEGREVKGEIGGP
ncbi:alpha/beta-hydrolase [Polychaeton citri CBS 116435]|uniref:Alpha/beta-hydrolase n=1 Tax=Polychaeton citri CBS 116435 TaxID=1314669 RepID=A0A9P4QG74_9PEZI|nr:alpha/beta-hydrolase [Polychaeton citri CBS 116435]